MPNEIFFGSDPITGEATMNTAIFESDNKPLDRPVLQLPQGYGDSSDHLDTGRRRKLLGEFQHYGIPVPKKLTAAFAVLDAVVSVRDDAVERPLVIGADPKKVADDVRRYIDALSRRSALDHGLSRPIADAHSGIRLACYSSVDDVLSGLSDRFDTLAQELAEVYPGVGEFWTVSDAAQADEDGSTVVRWNAAAKIAVALDRLTDLVLGLAHPKSQTGSTKPRSSINHARILTLHADPSTFDQAAYHRAIDGKSFRGGVFDTKRTPTGQAYPFGIYGLALDAGAVLSLPKSSADWSARADEFTRAQAFVDDSDDRDDDDL